MDTNRINEINAEVHKSTDLDGALSVYNLLKNSGYEIKSNMGSLMDYCKTRGLDRVKSNIELLVRYDEELGNKEKVTKDFYASIYSNDKSGILDRIEAIVNADTKYNIETDARYHGDNKPDNGKSIFTMKIEELKKKMGGDTISSKLEKARKSLEGNYVAFRNLTAEDLKSTKALKLRETIDQNRYYINQLEGMSSRNSYSIDSIDRVNAFNADVKELYNFINGLNLNDDSKKALIDEFGALRTKINDYCNYIANLQATSKKYDALLAEMDVVKVGKSVKKSDVKAASEEKKEEKVEPKEEVKTVTEPVKTEEPKKDDKVTEPEKEEVKETVNNDLLSVGDVVTYNGKSPAIADIGAPEGLVVGQEYKVEKVVIYKGLSYAKLEGVDKLVDIVCLDKVMKKDMEESTKEDDKKTEEEKNTGEIKVGEAVPFKIEEINEGPEKKKEEPKEEPTIKVEEKPSEASDNSEKTDNEKEKHDYKVKSIRKTVGKYAPWVWRTAAVIGIATSTFTPAVIIAGGWLAAEAIRFCVKRNYKLPKFGKFKDKMASKWHEISEKGEISEEESKDAEAVVSEIDNATKEADQAEAMREPEKAESLAGDVDAEELSRDIQATMDAQKSEKEKETLVNNIRSDSVTDEELNKLADGYIKAGKIEPGEYDRETLKSKVLDSIVEEYKSTDVKENTTGRTL
ncbi:unknown [Clostridium sp. CAG:533]|nr:unknown [Clostridium sp. CAG:533]